MKTIRMNDLPITPIERQVQCLAEGRGVALGEKERNKLPVDELTDAGVMNADTGHFSW